MQQRVVMLMMLHSVCARLVLLSGDEINSKQLRDDLMTMLIAGHETTAAGEAQQHKTAQHGLGKATAAASSLW
jgi:hypothetical protein